jgi:hypothetical protein
MRDGGKSKLMQSAMNFTEDDGYRPEIAYESAVQPLIAFIERNQPASYQHIASSMFYGLADQAALRWLLQRLIDIDLIEYRMGRYRKR